MKEIGGFNEKSSAAELKHEFKNLLNPVINLSKVLIRESAARLSGDEINYLKIILKNGERLLQITEELYPAEKNNQGGDQSADSECYISDKSFTGDAFTMLVIDDNPDNLIPVRAIIEHDFGKECEVFHALTGNEGIDLLSEINPDLVLIDINLPDISGFVLARNVKNFFSKKKVPVIAFTAQDLDQNREQFFASGFDDIIPKPFDIDKFVDKIRKWTTARWL